MQEAIELEVEAIICKPLVAVSDILEIAAQCLSNFLKHNPHYFYAFARKAISEHYFQPRVCLLFATATELMKNQGIGVPLCNHL